VEFRVLGPLEVVVEGESARLGGPRPRAVLGVLLAHAGRAVSVERLIEQVWGDAPPPTASSALQVHLSALRKIIGERLVTAASGYLLGAAKTEVDALRFEAMVTAARRHLTDHPDRAATELAIALSLWRGEPYAGVPTGSDVEAARRRLTELRLSVVEDRLDAELTLGRHAQVVSELAGLVVDHPMRERLARLYLLALYRCGRTANALAAYATYADRLRRELGVEPGEELKALHRAIQRGDPTIDTPVAVPTPASRFIGRRHELEALAAKLGETRLLTITGMGGVGKSRLALELIRDTAADHPDGVHLVELAALAAGSAIDDRVAAALNVRPSAGEPIADVLAARLRTARALLVLDNCEHVIDSAAKLAAELLSQSSGLRILATSRESLGIQGETVWPLAGLDVPGETATDAAAARTEAIRLLGDRGAAARPGFVISADNVAVATRLTRQLDGLPLAIELAAAQLRVLSLDEVAHRLDRRLELADARSRTTPERHRTMRAAIDRSYLLLAPEEQTQFARLAVFTGSFSLAAAEQVAGASAAVLGRLVDQSMLVADPQLDGTRFRLLELIREYALERLEEAGEADDRRRRHAAWYAEFAAAHEAYGGPDHADLVRRLGVDEENLRAALNWSVGRGGDPELGLRIASPLWWYWWTRGLMTEGRAWLKRGLELLDPAPSALRCVALRTLSSLSRNSGDYTEARKVGGECLAVAGELADEWAMSSALMGLCVTAVAQRDFEAALGFAEECRRLAERTGNRRRLGALLNSAGIALRCLGRMAEANEHFIEALEIFTTLDDRRGAAAAYCNLGFVARHAGDVVQARRHYRRSLALYREMGLVEGQLDDLDALALLEIAEGRPAAGVRLLAIADRELRRLGVTQFVPDELAARAAGWAAARAALGERVAEIVAAAASEPLEPVVDALLADPKLTGDG
jgi:predicted ATPase/DNA-binding SARP family transcriptional activator